MKYDFLIVGAGPFGATFARTATDLGKSCLVLDRRGHIGGNIYSEKIEGIDVHMYGPHIFHTDDEQIWEFVNRFGNWKPFFNNPRVRVGNRIFSFPINLLTLHQIWGVTTPAEARARLDEVRIPCDRPQNAEQWLLSQVGREIYELFFYGYTKKQWFKEPSELPTSIVTRLPIRLTYNDSYYSSKYQAVPAAGYTSIIENMLDAIDVELGVDFLTIRDSWQKIAKNLVFTGPIDLFFDYEFGKLDYRSSNFQLEIHEGDVQGHAIINYPDVNVKFVRIVEHKHFVDNGPKHIKRHENSKTVITKDFPLPPGHEQIKIDPQYPIRNKQNLAAYDKYLGLTKWSKNTLIGGRLGEYRYYDMDQVIGSAMTKARNTILGKKSASVMSGPHQAGRVPVESDASPHLRQSH